MSQYDRIGALLKRRKGATAAELIAATMTTSVHRRLFEMRQRGWTIWRQPIDGRPYGRYYGKAPKGA
jgi:hypothetical protein